MSAGRLSAGAMPVDATIGLDGASGELRFGGIFAPDPLRVQGDVRTEGRDLAEVLTRLWPGRQVPKLAQRPFKASASLLATEQSTEPNGLTLALGDPRATGTASLTLGEDPRGDVALSRNQN